MSDSIAPVTPIQPTTPVSPATTPADPVTATSSPVPATPGQTANPATTPPQSSAQTPAPETPATIVSIGQGLRPNAGLETPQIPAGNAGAAAAKLVIANALADLINNLPVTADVIGTDARGSAVLKAGDGTFFSIADKALPPGASVVLRAPAGDLQKALLVSVNNRLVEPPSPVSLKALPTQTQLGSLTAQTAAPMAQLQLGQPVGARLIAMVPDPNVRTASILQSATPGTSPVSLAGPEPGTSAEPGAMELKLVPRSITSPGLPAPPPAPGELQGKVLGRGLGGETLVKTDAGIIAIPLRTNVQPGTVINFALQDLAPSGMAQPGKLQQVLASNALAKFSEEWPAMREAINVLQTTHHDAAAKLIAQLPQPDARLLSSSLRYFSAMEGGNARSWIGEGPLEALKQVGRNDLAQQLVRDFDELSRLARPQGGTEWQAMVMPFFTGAEIRQIQVYVRKRKKKEKNNRPATRFVIDLELEKTGPLQFDGLTEDQRLDITLRSGKKLPAQWETDIRKLYDDCIGATGMKGGIAFQHGFANFVRPSEEIATADRSGLLA